MWKTIIIDGKGGDHKFETEDYEVTEWANAHEWAETMRTAVDVYVNHGTEGEIPTSIIKLEWVG